MDNQNNKETEYLHVLGRELIDLIESNLKIWFLREKPLNWLKEIKKNGIQILESRLQEVASYNL